MLAFNFNDRYGGTGTSEFAVKAAVETGVEASGAAIRAALTIQIS
jgi:hypothetical protein